MADVIGSTSTMPGSVHRLPENEVCDMHPDRPAVIRIQGETDSMGAELNDMCQECLDTHREYERTRDRSGKCDWCKKDSTRLSETRDYDEGMHGRIYMVCSPCIKKMNDEAAAELEEMRSRGDYDDFDYDD